MIDGDNLDLAFPPPWEHQLAERNLTAIWANYRALGFRRMIYTNSVCVRFTDQLAAAMGDDPAVTAVLLTASDETTSQRLGGRIQGSDLQEHVDRSYAAARELDTSTPEWVHRFATDNRSVKETALELISLTGWAGPGID